MDTVYFQTHGCSTNISESEMMAGFLKEDGYKIVKNKEEAQVIITNICTVKGVETAEREIKNNYSFCQQYGKKLIVAGCIPVKAYPQLREIAPEASFVSTHNISKIAEVVNETLADTPVTIITRDSKEKVGFPRVRINPRVSIIQINNSCSGACTFCSTVLIKGKLQSFDEKQILQDVSTAVKEGCGEVWITSMDTASYGLDKNEVSQLPDLVRKICAIGGMFKIRIGMMNPDTIAPVIDELLEVMKSQKVYKFLHIPLQAGNNDVLKRMNRKYTKEEFVALIEKCKKVFPYITIATDVICGFPGETEEDFQETIEVIQRIKPDSCHISRFQAREATLAAQMDDQLSGSEIKNRSSILTNIAHKIGRMQNEKWLGWEGWCYVSEKKKDFVGRNGAYETVVFKTEQNLKGKWVKTKITKIDTHHVYGNVLEIKEPEKRGIEIFY